MTPGTMDPPILLFNNLCIVMLILFLAIALANVFRYVSKLETGCFFVLSLILTVTFEMVITNHIGTGIFGLCIGLVVGSLFLHSRVRYLFSHFDMPQHSSLDIDLLVDRIEHVKNTMRDNIHCTKD